MKKTFKRSIACLLAVLMVAFSMPFTAFAATGPVDGYFYGPSAYGSNDRVIWWDEANPPQEEPDYIGYNDPEVSSLGAWGLDFGAQVDISIDAGADQKEDLFDEYRPVLAITASDYSSFSNAKTYGLNSTKLAYDDANILDPTNIQKGQKFAVTFEVGGFDALCTMQIKGQFDDTKIKLGAWGGRGNSTWSQCNDGTAKNAIPNISTNLTGLSNTGTTCSVTDHNFYAVQTSTYLPASTFVGAREFGKYGLVAFTLSFEAIENCDLRDVINIDIGDGGTFITPYNPSLRLALTRPELGTRCVYGFKGATPETDLNQYGYFAPVIWSNVPTEEPTPEHTHEYGAPTYQWADDNSTCTATMTCSTCEEGTEGHTVTETVDSQYSVVTPATCTTEGTGKYTATFTTNAAFEAQEKEVSIPVTDHTYGDKYAPVTDKTHAKVCTECGYVDSANAESCDFDYVETTPATCTTAGLGTYTCALCGNSYTVDIPAKEHTPNYAAADYKWTGNDEEGYTACVAVVPCSVCGDTALEVPATVTPVSDGATCTTPGKTTYTATFDDENLETQTKVVTGGTLPHDYDYENVEYTWDGTTSCKAVVKCKNCDDTIEATTTNITSEVTVPATCQTMGTTTYTATFEGDFGTATTEVQDVPTVGHNMVEVPGSAVEATVDNAGKYADKECSYGCGTTEPGAEIPQLAHYTVTATAENGTVEVQGVSPMNNVAVNGNITLVATPATEDLEFVGWSLNGKIVSTSTTYTTKAIADAAYVAIFKDAEQDTFTVVFTDQYGNVYSSQDVTSGAEVVMPDEPILVGFTFKGWSMTEDEIEALTDSATINAIFERTQEDSYTVTVPEGCTIDGVVGTTTSVDYNTLVTVKAPADATNGTWKVNGAAVAYGTSYTFFVGDNVTLTFEESDVVEAVPTVASISTSKDTASVKVAFLATRSVASGYTYVNAGFVYGKNLDNSELFLEKVGDKGAAADAGNIKACYCSTDAEQFRLSYGISTGVGKVSAKAFLAYVDNETGTTHVIYGEPQEYTY